jgi:putative transposase
MEIGRTTVVNILAEEVIEPAPEREKKRTWKQFMKMHWESLYACDVFSVEALGPFGIVRYMVLFVIELKSRAVEFVGIKVNSDGDWMSDLWR